MAATHENPATAVAPRLADRQWTVAEMIERTANYVAPAPKIPTLAEAIADLPETDNSPDYIPPQIKRLTIDDVVPDDE